MDALNFRTQKTGRVPTSFLADEYGESQALDALQFTDCMDAEHQLLLPVVELGTFILRFNQSMQNNNVITFITLFLPISLQLINLVGTEREGWSKRG